jgi:hypothetical protein
MVPRPLDDELYPVPYWSVSPDLVALAGGPDRVAAAAMAKVEAAPVEALHLAEAALAAEPGHRGALDASWRRTVDSSRRGDKLLGDALARGPDPHARAEAGRVVTDRIRIADLARPVLTDSQRAAVAAAERMPVTLREDVVLAAARQRTGLDDFGADDFRARLRVWLAGGRRGSDARAARPARRLRGTPSATS